MEALLVNSILTSVCSDFSLTGKRCPPMASPTRSQSSTMTSSGYSSSDEGDAGSVLNNFDLSSRRDILDLYSNMRGKRSWPYKATVLPSKDLKMFLTNRSVYHRCDGYPPEVSGVEECKCCGFPVPVILF